MAREQHLKSLLRFLLVGGTAVVLDAVSYVLLHKAGVPVDAAKAISFLIGAVFAYFANWRFTFGARRSRWSEVLFVVVYALALGINVAANAGVRAWLGTSTTDATIAFLVATGLSAAWNFVGMSLFVFRREESSVDHVAQR
ncbi:GtrA family protein [Blastococcus sp. CT_GayMR16]|uniref:GtrA family protein n=1 Tax=Blastococcus sp. CT_GayMR16 TaxID=2559607 RepID=UPI001ADDAA55|nr:GtrA family protein [Blastococcus sp. CT_GayMR16]